MHDFASLLGDQLHVKKYGRLATTLQNQVRAAFWDRPVPGPINRQTLFATLLYHGIIPENQLDAAADSLNKAMDAAPAGHLTTGIFGTKYALETLSEHISPQFVFDMVNSTEFPGWGHMIDRGATTIWETWKESDNVYSNCHPMFGTITEWYYRWLGGIRPLADHPGFREFILAPAVPRGLDFVNCTYHSPMGPIVSGWSRTPEYIRYEMKVPEGTVARVSLDPGGKNTISIEKNGIKLDPGTIEGLQSGQFRLGEGNYAIQILSYLPAAESSQ